MSPRPAAWRAGRASERRASRTARARWTSTVLTVTYRAAAICLLDSPSAASSLTWRSLGVSSLPVRRRPPTRSSSDFARATQPSAPIAANETAARSSDSRAPRHCFRRRWARPRASRQRAPSKRDPRASRSTDASVSDAAPVSTSPPIASSRTPEQRLKVALAQGWCCRAASSPSRRATSPASSKRSSSLNASTRIRRHREGARVEHSLPLAMLPHVPQIHNGPVGHETEQAVDPPARASPRARPTCSRPPEPA